MRLNEFESVPSLPNHAEREGIPWRLKKSAKKSLPTFDSGTTFFGKLFTFEA
jgi:hypothetical protein